MTQVNIHPAEQGSRANEYVAGILMTVVLLLAAILPFAQFTA